MRLAACAAGAAALAAVALEPARAQSRGPRHDGSAPTCFLTGGGGLEICRDGSEAEGVLVAPPPCTFVRGVQVLQLARSEAPGPLQMVFQGPSPVATRRGEPCPPRRADDAGDGGALRTGRSPAQLATTLPPTADRFWTEPPAAGSHRRRGRRPEPAAASPEGIGPRDPVAVAGRDWAGEAYTYVVLLAREADADLGDRPRETARRGRRRRAEPIEAEPVQPEPAAEGRRVQILARTLDFERFEVRTRPAEGAGPAWTPVAPRRNGRAPDLTPAALLDVEGKPVASACPGSAEGGQGLSGSISVIERTYHYLYTDALPEECGQPPERRRTALYLRTASDLSAPLVWSAARRIQGPLPPGSLVRAARAKGMARWALSYTCQRPANAPGGPVADICLQYTADLSLDGLTALRLYAEPADAGRSPAYLGLRSGGDGSGRFDRSAHFWMTDAQGNLDTPGIYPGKAGLLTWLDRLAPESPGGAGSSVYGRPVYWATWTVRPVGAP